MTRRADKFFAKRMEGGSEPERPALRAAAGSPDGYHSAKETSDFDDDTKEEAQEVESDVEQMLKSDNSDDSSVQSDHASLHSQRSTTENRTGRESNADLRLHIPTELRTQEGDQRQNSGRKEVQSGAVHVPRFQERRGAGVCQLESRSGRVHQEGLRG